MGGVFPCVSEAQISGWKNYKKGWDLAWRTAQQRPGFQQCDIGTLCHLALFKCGHYDGVEMNKEADIAVLCS